MNISRLGAAMLASLAFCSGAGAQDWTGVWAADPAWCQNADVIGESESAPVRLSAAKIEGLENTCDITNVSPTGVGQSWRIDQSCWAEGYNYRYSELIVLDHAGDLHRLGQEGVLSSFVRCEGL